MVDFGVKKYTNAIINACVEKMSAYEAGRNSL